MKALFAMDLMNGKCVRLKKGDFSKVTVYSDNPVVKIREMRKMGARDFHIIDLDGARTGRRVHHELIKELRLETEEYMEVGGGIRDFDDIQFYTDTGINGIIIGTRALEDSDFLRKLSPFKNIVLGLDLLDGKPMARGWKTTVTRDVREILAVSEDVGIMAILCTSIERDGMLSGPDYKGLRELASVTKLPVIASGGVTSIDDVKKLKDSGVWATILGKAVYEGLISIEEAAGYAD